MTEFNGQKSSLQINLGKTEVMAFRKGGKVKHGGRVNYG
jgi:hypothetical protein